MELRNSDSSIGAGVTGEEETQENFGQFESGVAFLALLGYTVLAREKRGTTLVSWGSPPSSSGTRPT